MKASKVHAVTVVGVLALPLIAVLAMVMFFSFSQSGPNQAEAANQGSATAMELRVPANAEVGAKFTITVAGNLTPPDPIAAFGLDIFTSAGVSYNGSDDCLAEIKVRNVGGGDPATCISQVNLAGGHLIAVLSQVAAPPLTELDVATSSKVVLANLSYSCDTVGVQKITLTTESVDPDGAVYGRASDSAAVAVKTEDQGGVQVADSASITCVPQAGAININVVDANVQTKTLSNSCWLISVDVVGGSPPVPINKPVAALADNNAKAQCDVPIKSSLTDSNPAVGEIDVEISGKLLEEFGTVWHFQQIQGLAKYNIDATKYTCTLSGLFVKTDGSGRTACDEADPYVIKNVLKEGTLTIKVSGNLGSEQVCFNIEPGAKNVCRNGAGDITQNLALGDYTVTSKDNKIAAVSQQLKAGVNKTQDCNLSAIPQTARTCNVSYNYEGQKVFHLKTPSLSNLFLTNQQGQAKNFYPTEAGTTIAPSTCRAGTDVALFTNKLSLQPGTLDPKGSGNVQRVAAFEMEVRYDPKWVCVNIVPGDYWFLQANKTNPFASGNVRAAAQAISDSALPVAGGKSPISLTDGSSGVVCFIDDKNDGQQATGIARIGCVTTGKVLKNIDQTVPLAYVLVKPQPEVYNQIIPNQENGIKTMILNAGCNLADDQGHPIDSSGCDDASLTIRWLEADFNGDCKVDVIDQQAVSSRWGSKAGSLLYNARMDTMPFGNIQGDQRIDIKDVQFAFGRNGSECGEQNRFKIAGTPHPDQNPVPNK